MALQKVTGTRLCSFSLEVTLGWFTQPGKGEKCSIVSGIWTACGFAVPQTVGAASYFASQILPGDGFNKQQQSSDFCLHAAKSLARTLLHT